MKTFVVWNVFEEAGNLPRAMDSVELHIGPRAEVVHVCIDGRYPDFDAPREFSMDGTRDIALERGILLDCYNYECEKRTFGLSHIDTLAEDGDWVLVQDADEELTSIFGWPQRVGSIQYTRESRPVTYGRCRLYRWEPGLHFKHRHYDLYDKDGNLVSSLEDAPDFQVIGSGIHRDLAHDPLRKQVKKAYYTRLRERESHPSVQPIGA